MRGMITGLGWKEKLVLEVRGENKQEVEIGPGDDLALTVSESRGCVGYRPPEGKSLIPCPDKVSNINAAQCDDCLQRAKILPCLRCVGTYCRNPERRKTCVLPENHALYIACFGPDIFKVGVSKWERRHQRLAEQGARKSLIIARDDGQMIRRSEAMVKSLGVPDRLSPASKLEAVSLPFSDDEMEDSLHELLASLKKRMRAEWIEPEQVKLPEIPEISHTRLIPVPGLEISGRVTTTVGQILVIEDEGQQVALDGASLVGRTVTSDVAQSNYQMALI